MSLEAVVELLAGAPFPWWIAGGLALELHLGRSWRAHDDTDVGIRRTDAPAVHRWLEAWDLHVAAAGELHRWHGQPLDAGAGENNVWMRGEAGASWVLDLTVGDGDEDSWIYRRDPAVRRPWGEVVRTTAGGIPYLVPEVQLLFKSCTLRPKDDLDARLVVPVLDHGARAFLGAALPAGHPWRSLL